MWEDDLIEEGMGQRAWEIEERTDWKRFHEVRHDPDALYELATEIRPSLSRREFDELLKAYHPDHPDDATAEMEWHYLLWSA